MWHEIILQISCMVFTLLLMLNVIYFTICHDSIIYLPLFYIQLWQEQPIRWVKLSASAENLTCLFLFLSVTDSLSRHIFPQVPLRLFSISLSFFLSLLSMSFVSTVPTICGLIPAILKHSSCSQKQLCLTSPGAAQFLLWLFTFPYVSFPFHFIDWKFDSIFSVLAWLLSFLQFFSAAFILCCFSVSLLSYWQSKRRIVN